MAKNTSLFGKVSGKIGAVVFSTSGGQTISREYNPNVSNPNTEAQVNQRAKMKLMSQISSALAPVLTFKKDGLVSARNQFVKSNFNWARAESGIAEVSYENLQITASSRGLGQIRVQTSGSVPSIGITTRPSADIKSVVYALFGKNSEGALDLIGSYVVSTAVNDTAYGDMYYELYMDEEIYPNLLETYQSYNEVVVYAYGISENAETANAKYGNVSFQTAQDIARLVANRTIDFSQTSFTQTRGTTLYPNGEVTPPVPEGSFRVFVTASPSNAGTVTGAGVYTDGTRVTVNASPAEGYEFVAWRDNGSSSNLTTDATYSFDIHFQRDLVAVFRAEGL